MLENPYSLIYQRVIMIKIGQLAGIGVNLKPPTTTNGYPLQDNGIVYSPNKISGNRGYKGKKSLKILKKCINCI